ncbi:MAG: hypothetical protein JSU70_12970 [Phycisphaerales bacterium]|nr:MAG: hypothetical protein JSU70_12970 [Phycisphaerales bacterium]
MKRIFICFVILLLAMGTVAARTVELVLHPAKASESARRCRLLPLPSEQSDEAAAPLYEQALKALPAGLDMNQLHEWRSAPAGQLPKEQVEQVLQQGKQALDLLERAARCRQHDWPYLDPDTAAAGLGGYRKLVVLIALQARLQIGQGRYDEAVETMRTGFAMAGQLGKAPTLVEGLVAIAVAAVMCSQLEQFVQEADAPNLYWALQALPRPYLDLSEQMEYEDRDTKEKTRLLMNRLDRHLAALQCVEAIRLYADRHGGKLPDGLSSITELVAPNDPVAGRPFDFRLAGTKGILEAAAPEGGSERDALRYEMVMKEQ